MNNDPELLAAIEYVAPLRCGTDEFARYGGLTITDDKKDVWDVVHELAMNHRTLADYLFSHDPLPKKEELTIADYQAVLEDHKRLVRELDVLLNGVGAAKQASLCDIVAQLKKQSMPEPLDETTFTPDLPDEIEIGGIEYVKKTPNLEPVSVKLLAACERVATLIDNGLLVAKPMYEGEDAITSDVIGEAKAAISAAHAQAEDDVKSVDREWMMSIGFILVRLPVDNDPQLALVVFDDKWAYPDGDVLLVYSDDGSYGFWERPLDPDGDWSAYHNNFKKLLTRGDVRRLLFALGIKQ